MAEVGGVGVVVTTQVAGEQTGLDMGKEAEGHFFFQEGVGDFGLFAFLPVGEDGFAGVFAEIDSAVFAGFEVFFGDLLAIEEGEGGAVGEDGAKFFHEVECEGGASGAVAVEKAALGVEPAGFGGASAIVGKEHVEEGEEGVDGILWWSAVASLQGELGIGEEVRKGGKVEGGGIAFDTAQAIEVGGCHGVAYAVVELVGGGEEFGCAVG